MDKYRSAIRQEIKAIVTKYDLQHTHHYNFYHKNKKQLVQDIRLKNTLAIRQRPYLRKRKYAYVQTHSSKCQIQNSPTEYAVWNFEGKRYRAHRLSWAIHNEIDIGSLKKDDIICHSCDNRGCINPEHLWLGTCSENIRDMWLKGRGIGRKHPTIELVNKSIDAARKRLKQNMKKIRGGVFSKEDIVAIRENFISGYTVTQLQKKYGYTGIRNILKGDYYEWVPLSKNDKIAIEKQFKEDGKKPKRPYLLSVEQHKEVSLLFIQGYTYEDLALQYGVSPITIKNAATRFHRGELEHA